MDQPLQLALCFVADDYKVQGREVAVNELRVAPKAVGVVNEVAEVVKAPRNGFESALYRFLLFRFRSFLERGREGRRDVGREGRPSE